MKAVSPVMPRCESFALFSYGFRPFFLLAGWYAAVSILLWLWLYRSGTSLLPSLPPQLWHGHEMLFGFVGAAIAGFMLTAVPSWTGTRGFGGLPLVVLATTWVLGRIAFALADRVPEELLAVAELAFLPGVFLLVAPPVLRTMNRNVPLLLVLAVFWCLDAAFLRAAVRGDAALARDLLQTTLGVVLTLITIIGGRIVPAFTASALRTRGMVVTLRSRPVLERLVIGSMVALVLADLFRAPESFTASIAGAAAVAHFARIAGWRTRHTFRDPIVWILHAAYYWLPVGLALRALHALGGWAFAAHWVHALGAGAAATMVLAVMTRAALGHTGRPLRVARPIVWSYGLLIAAGVVRVFGPAVLPIGYLATIMVASAAWIAAFLLFAIVYTPVLFRSRIDGRPG